MNSGSGRVLHKHKGINYNKLHQGMEQDQSSDEEIDTNVDLVGEKELCGLFDEQEELDYEEHVTEQNSELEDGEISSEESDSENEMDMEKNTMVKECIRKQDIDKLKELLRKKQEANQKLEKQIVKERQCEQKEKEMQEIL